LYSYINTVFPAFLNSRKDTVRKTLIEGLEKMQKKGDLHDLYENLVSFNTQMMKIKEFKHLDLEIKDLFKDTNSKEILNRISEYSKDTHFKKVKNTYRLLHENNLIGKFIIFVMVVLLTFGSLLPESPVRNILSKILSFIH